MQASDWRPSNKKKIGVLQDDMKDADPPQCIREFIWDEGALLEAVSDVVLGSAYTWTDAEIYSMESSMGRRRSQTSLPQLRRAA